MTEPTKPALTVEQEFWDAYWKTHMDEWRRLAPSNQHVLSIMGAYAKDVRRQIVGKLREKAISAYVDYDEHGTNHAAFNAINEFADELEAELDSKETGQ